MKIALGIIVLIHGLIHLVGFAKAFQLANIPRINLPITKPIGLLWLLTALLFLLVIISHLFDFRYWWLIALAAIVLSQILIVLNWQNTKFGTVVNLIILLATTVGFSKWSYQRARQVELSNLLGTVSGITQISDEALSGLPSLVVLWLHNSNALAVGKPAYATILQEGEMKTSPEGKWYPFTAKHWCTSEKPGFLWVAKMKVTMGIEIAVRDEYNEGKGNMLVKLLSMITLGDASGLDIDQGALIRYLAEIVWAPSLAISPYIQWTQINNLQVSATITYGGQEGSALFTFNNQGLPIKVEAQRYYYRKEGSTIEPWVVILDEDSYKSFNGISVPAKAEITWKLKEGDYTWFKMLLEEVEYK